jgi:hypothetical protein
MQQQEPYVSVPQPGPTDPEPVYDSAHPPVGAFPTDQSSLSPTVAAGDSKVFVASQGSVQARDAATLALLQTFPSPPGGSIGSAQGLAYYRGELFVSDPGWNSVGRVVVYDESGNYKRTLPGQYAGIDVAWGEIWGRPPSYPARLEAREIQTGAVRAEVPLGNQPPYVNCPSTVSTTSALGCSPTTWQPGSPPSQDVSVAADSNGIFTGPYTASRGLATDLLSFSTSLLTGPNSVDLTCPNGHIQADRELRQPSGSGSTAVWGMHWFITTTNCGDDATNPGPRVAEYAITNDAAGQPQLTYARGWIPGIGTSSELHGAFSDVAYQTHRPRIDWLSGNLADPIHWMERSQCVQYVVSDGDYYVAAYSLAHYLRPAAGFSPPVRLYLDDIDPGHTTPLTLTSGDPTQPTGTLCVDTQQPYGANPPAGLPTALPSGIHRLTMTATVTGSQVTNTNPTLHVDHDAPTGTLDPLPAATNATVNATGTVNDAHSGAQSWQLQVNGPGTGGWRTACPATTPDPSTGKWGCAWDTTTYAEGTYQVQALLTDQVGAAYGGANTATVAGGNVIVDRQNPTLALSNDLAQRAADNAPTHPGFAEPLDMASTDGGSGTASLSVTVDGVPADTARQSCPSGGCGLSRTFSFAPESYSDGQHTVQASATDGAGNTATQSIVVDVDTNPGGPCPSDRPTECGQPPSNGSSSATARSRAAATPDLPPSPVDTSKTLPCTDASSPVNFQTYSLGSQFQGLALAAVLRRCEPPNPLDGSGANFVSYIYGTCDPGTHGCAPPVEVQTWPACERNLASYDPPANIPADILPPPPQVTRVAGTAAAILDSGYQVEVYTGGSTVIVYGTNTAQVLQAANALQQEPTGSIPNQASAVLATAGLGSLPPPVPGAVQGNLGCQ